MAKITKPSWLGDRTYVKKASYPDDDLEHLIMSTLSKVNVLYDEITANNQKTGISSSQASAIVANTAKTGISTSQASAITANTKKIGMSLEKGIDNLSFSFSKGTLSVTVISGKDRYVVGLKMTKL